MVLVKPPEPFVTKLMPPKRPFGLVRRERLHRALARAVERHRVAVLSAPAGYGKTALVADFAADLAAPVCWYSVDREDDSPHAFFRFLLASIRRQFPDFGEATLQLLNTSSDVAPILSTLVGSLVSEIQQQIPDWFLLVLDDLHWCSDSNVLSGINLMLRHLPENCFVIITSRTRPPLGALTRLGAQRSLTRLTDRDLAFREDEVRELLRSSGHNVGQGVAKTLTDESEGWAAGIVLLAPWLDQPSFLASLDRTINHDELFLYLSEEVFLRLPERWQEFLTTISLVQDISIDLCVEAFGYADAASLLKEMESSGLFLTQVGDGSAYRCHALFREFLLDRAREDPCRFNVAHGRAADFYATHGQWAEAMKHYLATDRADQAAEVLERCAPDLYRRGEWSLLAEAAADLPPQVGARRHRLLLWRARCLVHLGEPDIALALAEHTGIAPGAEGDSIAASLREMVRSGALRSKGNSEGAMAAARNALRYAQTVEQEPSIQLLRGEAHHQLGACLFTAGCHQEALLELDEALELYAPLGSLYHLARVHMNLGSTLYRLGRYPDAVAHYEQAIDASRRVGHSVTLAATLNNLGNLYVSLGSFALAQDVLRSALEAARLSGNIRVAAYATHSLGDALAAGSQFGAAAGMLRVAIELCREAGEAVLEARVLLSLARTCSRMSSLRSVDEAEALLERAKALIALRPTPYDLGLLSFSIAALKLRRGDFSAARPALADALHQFEDSGDLRWSERTLLLLAQAAFKLEDLESSAGYLQRLEAAASSEAGPAALRPEAALAQDVLEYAVGNFPGGSAFVRLLAAADAALAMPAEPPAETPSQSIERPLIRAYGLGAFALERNGTPIEESSGLPPKAKELFFFLLAAGRRARRDQLIEALWPESEAVRDGSVLRTNVHRLRKVLYEQCIVIQGDFYKLDPSGQFWFDAQYFKELLERSRGSECSPVERLLLLDTAVQLYRGPFLDELSSDWCERERYNLEVSFASAALTLASIYLGDGKPGQAIPLCERVLAHDPLNEDAMLMLVRSYLSTGDRGAAMLHWRAFERRLRSEVGVPPSCEAASQYQRLIQSQKVAS